MIAVAKELAPQGRPQAMIAAAWELKPACRRQEGEGPGSGRRHHDHHRRLQSPAFLLAAAAAAVAADPVKPGGGQPWPGRQLGGGGVSKEQWERHRCGERRLSRMSQGAYGCQCIDPVERGM